MRPAIWLQAFLADKAEAEAPRPPGWYADEAFQIAGQEAWDRINSLPVGQRAVLVLPPVSLML